MKLGESFNLNTLRLFCSVLIHAKAQGTAIIINLENNSLKSMNVKATLASIVLASSISVSGCSDSEKTGVNPVTHSDSESIYQSPQVAFAEWMAANDITYFGSPDWCQPCQMFEYDLTPQGFAVLEENGNFVKCSTYYGEGLSQACADAGVKAVPSFSAPWLNGLMEGYPGLETLARNLGYPGSPIGDDPHNYNGGL